MSFEIEAGIEPLVDTLNRFDFMRTVYSCEGHFDRPPRKKFLPTAYATFGVSDVGRFARLYERIRSLEDSDPATRLRLTYDCVLGRYTLSVWAVDSIRDSSRKRSVVDSAVKRLSDVILNHAESASSRGVPKKGAEPGETLPCGERIPPCILVIPQKELVCPFTQ